MDSMDFDSASSSSQSPTPTGAIDPLFIMKHNASAEIYQIFKDDVDLLLSGKVSYDNQHALISRILHTTGELLAAFEVEKQYLMSDALCAWAIRQQKLSVGTLWTQEMHYRQLDTIHLQFEYFGELLEQTLSGLEYLVQHVPTQGFDVLLVKLKQLAHYFLYYSIIVARQPPPVVVKCGEAENHRRSRFWFNTEIRVLGGRAFGIETTEIGKEVKCFLITDETARQLLNDAYFEVNENEEFAIEPPASTFQRKDTRGIRAKFDDMRVAKKGQLRRDSVSTKRYCLCYVIRISASHGIELSGKKLSLPFAVLVGPKYDVEAKLFLERSFAPLVRHPLSDIPATATFDELADAMEMKFQSIVETPQKSTDGPSIVQPRMLTTQSKNHLIMRLKPNNPAQIPLESFMKMTVAEEFTSKKAITNAAATDGEWRLVPYFEWFFKLAEIINKLIFGFCGKEEAEHLLRSCLRPALLIRFSDIEYGKIKISVLDRTGVFSCVNNNSYRRIKKVHDVYDFGENFIEIHFNALHDTHSNCGIYLFAVIKHHWYDYSDLTGRNLAKELLSNQKFAGVEVIYPDINLEVALGGRQTRHEEHRKPRTLETSPYYFANQGAATAM